MKKSLFTFLFALSMLVSMALAGGRPTAILGPGTGGANFRVPYHETTHRVLSADTTYILTDWYFIDTTYSITIPPGTLIRGDSLSAGTLIIKRGAQIFAMGKATHPIIFTSNDAIGQRQTGDWGGIILLGSAITNKPATQQIEGGFGTIANTDAQYGGSDPNDNSGVLQYVRIEFPGIAFAVNNEINGLTMGGVGSGTTIDHIQVSFGGDDDFEFFGGSVHAKYLVGWRGVDDNFDTDFGFDGSIQFAYAKRDPNKWDLVGESNGFESDNEGSAGAYPYYAATPRTKPRYSNMTLIGPQSDTADVVNSRWQHSGLLRRSSETSIYNSIMMGWPWGINLRDTLTQAAADNDLLEIRNTSLQAAEDASKTVYTSSSPSSGVPAGFIIKDWFDGTTPHTATANLGSTPRQVSDVGLPTAAFNLNASNNPVPNPGSEAATAGTSYQGRLAGDAWFDSVGYRGAFDPSKPRDQQWDYGWTNYDPENYDPEAGPFPVNVEFRLNMSVKAAEGSFNPAEDYVLVRGSFNGWGESDTLTDGNNDSIYTKTITNFNPGDTINFKFYYRDVSASQDAWENDPNRTYAIPDAHSIYEAYFNNDSVVSSDITVYFSVNMELERLSGRFQPGDDTVSVNGDFNGWTPKTTILLPNGLNPDLYEGSIVVNGAEGEAIHFKFWYEDNNWESISDRVYTFTATDVTNGFATIDASFNNGTLETVLNQPACVKFTVYMPGAVSAITTNPFPAVNTVHIAGSALPLQWPNGGWPDADSGRMIKLYDDGTNGDIHAGDGVFSRDVMFPAYTSLEPQYKYGANFGDAVNNEGGNDNENAFGSNHELTFTRYMTNVTTVDTFGVMGTSTLKHASDSGHAVLNFATDWNMVSVPVCVDDFSKEALFPTATSSAFSYQAGYSQKTTLKNGEGYWLKYGGAETDTLRGGEIFELTFPVNTGWNMIGSISSSINVATITSNPGGLVTGQFFGYSGGYNSATMIEPGKAYWVKVTGSGTLTLSTGTLVGAKNRIHIVPTNELPPPPPQANDNEENVPAVFSLGQNYPNPFNPTTNINFSLQNQGIVTLTVFNVLGQEVANLANAQEFAQGKHSLMFDASNLTSGMYYYRLTVKDAVSGAVTYQNGHSMILVK